MKVLVVGAKGMVARAVTAHCNELRDTVLPLAREALDISDRESVFRTIHELTPEVVYNCAAYTDVDGAETNEGAAYDVNSTGPENLAAASREFGATFVTISTDYVFDGTRDGFYTQENKPNPQSIYARSKYEGELRSVAANPDAIVVRSGWIYGHEGTNFLCVATDLLSRGQEFKAIDDAFGTPTFAGDLAARLRELAVLKASGTFHATNFGPGVSYYDFVLAVANKMDADAGIVRRITSNELNRPAVRPRNSRLRCIRSEARGLGPLRDWKDALNAFLNERGGTTPPLP